MHLFDACTPCNLSRCRQQQQQTGPLLSLCSKGSVPLPSASRTTSHAYGTTQRWAAVCYVCVEMHDACIDGTGVRLRLCKRSPDRLCLLALHLLILNAGISSFISLLTGQPHLPAGRHHLHRCPQQRAAVSSDKINGAQVRSLPLFLSLSLFFIALCLLPEQCVTCLLACAFFALLSYLQSLFLPHRLVLTAILLAAKCYEDTVYNNVFYAKVRCALCTHLSLISSFISARAGPCVPSLCATTCLIQMILRHRICRRHSFVSFAGRWHHCEGAEHAGDGDGQTLGLPALGGIN